MEAFADSLFPPHGFSGLTVRRLVPPDSRPVTVIFIEGLIAPAALERLVLTPLSAGGVVGSPADLGRCGRFPAPALRVTDEVDSVRKGLVSGLAAIHVDGYAAVLLVGAGEPAAAPPMFTPNLAASTALLVAHLPEPDVRVEQVTGADGSHSAVVYLQSKAAGELVGKVKKWCGQQGAPLPNGWTWRRALGTLRLPPAVECASPAALAVALKQGYVAVLSEYRAIPVLAPTTLEQLLSGAGDIALPPVVRRLVFWPRLGAAIVGLTLGAMLIAITGYHHALMPGPFLMAVAASRQNTPFPVVLEILAVAVLNDVVEAAAFRTAGRRAATLSWIGTVLAVVGAMQMGVLGAVAGITGITASAARLIFPNLALGRAIRVWRYSFMVAGAGLGVYGITLLTYVLMVYLGEERAFGNPIRIPPGGVTS